MPDFNCLKQGFVLLALLGSASLAVAQQTPTLKQLLELDTRATPDPRPPAAPRVSRPAPRPQLLAIYGPSGQRTVLLRVGEERLLFQENQATSLPPSSYQLLGIEQHCARFRRTGQRQARLACLSPAAEWLAPRAAHSPPSRASSLPPSLPWPVKETP